MDIFKRLFGLKDAKPGPEEVAQFAPVPPVSTQLPKITATTAAQIAQESNAGPAARPLLKSQQTAPQYFGVLQEQKLGDKMVKTMAYGLSNREGVWRAVLNAQRVSAHLPPDDLLALQAALNRVKNPTVATGEACADADRSSRPRRLGGSSGCLDSIGCFSIHTSRSGQAPTLGAPGGGGCDGDMLVRRGCCMLQLRHKYGLVWKPV